VIELYGRVLCGSHGASEARSEHAMCQRRRARRELIAAWPAKPWEYRFAPEPAAETVIAEVSWCTLAPTMPECLGRPRRDSHVVYEANRAAGARHLEPPAHERAGGRRAHTRRGQCRGAEVSGCPGQEGRRVPIQGRTGGRAARARGGADP